MIVDIPEGRRVLKFDYDIAEARAKIRTLTADETALTNARVKGAREVEKIYDGLNAKLGEYRQRAEEHASKWQQAAAQFTKLPNADETSRVLDVLGGKVKALGNSMLSGLFMGVAGGVLGGSIQSIVQKVFAPPSDADLRQYSRLSEDMKVLGTNVSELARAELARRQANAIHEKGVSDAERAIEVIDHANAYKQLMTALGEVTIQREHHLISERAEADAQALLRDEYNKTTKAIDDQVAALKARTTSQQSKAARDIGGGSGIKGISQFTLEFLGGEENLVFKSDGSLDWDASRKRQLDRDEFTTQFEDDAKRVAEEERKLDQIEDLEKRKKAAADRAATARKAASAAAAQLLSNDLGVMSSQLAGNRDYLNEGLTDLKLLQEEIARSQREEHAGPDAGELRDAMEGLKSFAKELQDVADEDRKTWLEKVFGDIDDFNLYQTALSSFTGAVVSAYDTMVAGQLSGVDAAEAVAKAVITSLGHEAQVQAIIETAKGFAALADPTGLFGGKSAAFHFKSAALFEVGAVAAGVVAHGMGGGGGGGSGGGSAAPGGNYSSAGNGGTEIHNHFYADAYANKSYIDRQREAEDHMRDERGGGEGVN